MIKWLNPVELETENILLIPMKWAHKTELLKASLDGNLAELWYTTIPQPGNIDQYFSKALDDFAADTGLAFVVYHKKLKVIIGTTRYLNAIPEHRRLEIGFTWYAKSFQRTFVNSECKLLLLTHAFEDLGAIAVEFRTHWFNFPSRNAILRLGAKQDGVLRNHQLLPDGTMRDTVVFSIIESEWPACKRSLAVKIEQIHQSSHV